MPAARSGLFCPGGRRRASGARRASRTKASFSSTSARWDTTPADQRGSAVVFLFRGPELRHRHPCGGGTCNVTMAHPSVPSPCSRGCARPHRPGRGRVVNEHATRVKVITRRTSTCSSRRRTSSIAAAHLREDLVQTLVEVWPRSSPRPTRGRAAAAHRAGCGTSARPKDLERTLKARLCPYPSRRCAWRAALTARRGAMINAMYER
jgi:hypothetical protein